MAYDATTIQSAYAFFTGNRGSGVSAGVTVAPATPVYAPQNPGYVQAPIYGGDQYVNAAQNQVAQLRASLANAGRQVQGTLQGAFNNVQAQVASIGAPVAYAPTYAPSYAPAAPAIPPMPRYVPAPPAPYMAQAQNNPLAQIAQVIGSITGQSPQGPYYGTPGYATPNYQVQNAVNSLSANVNQLAGQLQQTVQQIGNNFRGYGYRGY